MTRRYLRTCSQCEQKFYGAKMDYRCPDCVEALKAKLSRRGEGRVERRERHDLDPRAAERGGKN